MLYPLTFHPILKERIWGGRKLAELFRKPLPPTLPIGESWEISDRPGDASVVANGPLAGRDLRWLMEHHSNDLLGLTPAAQGRFPLLCKILDAREKLSLQVHPPATLAAQMGGEPKTEMWYVAQAEPEADLFVGLKRGVTRSEFARKAADGTVAECFHRIPVRAGDAMFLPSGRVHALGAGNVIFEIQQNSDTTYRVFDWNRRDASGQLRDLHLEQSLASIDFDDFEPALAQPAPAESLHGVAASSAVVRSPLFSVDLWEAGKAGSLPLASGTLQILAVLEGSPAVVHGAEVLALEPGQFCLIPASLRGVDLRMSGPTSLLHVRAG